MQEDHTDKVYKTLSSHYKNKGALNKLPSREVFNQNVAKGSGYLDKVHGVLGSYYNEIGAPSEIPDKNTFVSKFNGNGVKPPDEDPSKKQNAKVAKEEPVNTEGKPFVKGTKKYGNAQTQKKLKDAGLYDGKIDGVWGKESKAAKGKYSKIGTKLDKNKYVIFAYYFLHIF